VDGTQPFKLLAVYLLMMLPFFCGGFGIGLVFAHSAGRRRASMRATYLGAGAGSLGIIACCSWFAPSQR